VRQEREKFKCSTPSTAIYRTTSSFNYSPYLILSVCRFPSFNTREPTNVGLMSAVIWLSWPSVMWMWNAWFLRTIKSSGIGCKMFSTANVCVQLESCKQRMDLSQGATKHHLRNGIGNQKKTPFPSSTTYCPSEGRMASSSNARCGGRRHGGLWSLFFVRMKGRQVHDNINSSLPFPFTSLILATSTTIKFLWMMKIKESSADADKNTRTSHSGSPSSAHHYILSILQRAVTRSHRVLKRLYEKRIKLHPKSRSLKRSVLSELSLRRTRTFRHFSQATIRFFCEWWSKRVLINLRFLKIHSINIDNRKILKQTIVRKEKDWGWSTSNFVHLHSHRWNRSTSNSLLLLKCNWSDEMSEFTRDKSENALVAKRCCCWWWWWWWATLLLLMSYWTYIHCCIE